jgi:hypothetical protein
MGFRFSQPGLQWVLQTPERAIAAAYEAALRIEQLEQNYFDGGAIAPSPKYGRHSFQLLQLQLRRNLTTIDVRLAELKTSSTCLRLLGRNSLADLSNTAAPSDRPSALQKLATIDSVRARYTSGRRQPPQGFPQPNASSQPKTAIAPGLVRQSRVSPPVNPLPVQQPSPEAVRMQEVTVLLDRLLRREEVLTKQILSCLYDVGTTNWIDRKVAWPPFNRLTKGVAKVVEPAASTLVLRKFQERSPQLIANWLSKKVSFGQPIPQIAASPLEQASTQKANIGTIGTVQAGLAKAKVGISDKQSLRPAQWLTGLSATAIAVLVGTTLWLSATAETERRSPEQQMRPVAVENCDGDSTCKD